MSAMSAKLLVGQGGELPPQNVEEVDFDHKLDCSCLPIYICFIEEAYFTFLVIDFETFTVCFAP